MSSWISHLNVVTGSFALGPFGAMLLRAERTSRRSTPTGAPRPAPFSSAAGVAVNGDAVVADFAVVAVFCEAAVMP